MLEAVRASEKSVNFNVTSRRYIPGDSMMMIAKLRISKLVGE
jgi:hypothetical protein